MEVEKMKNYTFINSLPSKDNCNIIQKVVSRIREIQIIKKCNNSGAYG